MQNIVIDKPYVPILPHRGRIWPTILYFLIPHLLAKKFRVTKVQCIDAEKISQSISAGHGVMLAPNHVRDEDPLIMGVLGHEVRSPFFVMASWHVFMQSEMLSFFLRRAGVFSIYREGIDRGAVNLAVEILENAERPLVIFPEGIISRANDRINDLLDGAALMARTAAKRRAKMQPPGKVVVHPIALRYHFQGDINAAANVVLDDIESRLTWRKQKDLSLQDRIHKTGSALLALKEIEYLGHPQTGDIGPRLQLLIDAILNPLEDEWLKGRQTDSTPTRVKRIRTALLPDLATGELPECERQRRWKQLADVYLAQQLFHYPADYLGDNSTPDRILETIERFEEDITDRITVHGEMHATITVGDAIEVPPARESRGATDPLLQQIESQWRKMLGLGLGA